MFITEINTHQTCFAKKGFVNDSEDKIIKRAIYTRVKTNHVAIKREDK